ncbi:hypothetical protein BV898_20103, partial [Hypsibius exemplaris]
RSCMTSGFSVVVFLAVADILLETVLFSVDIPEEVVLLVPVATVVLAVQDGDGVVLRLTKLPVTSTKVVTGSSTEPNNAESSSRTARRDRTRCE